MIDITAEQLIPLRNVPELIPSTRAGKRLNIATVWRWANSGAGGRRLETVKIGGSTFTSVEAVQRFVQQRAEPATVAPVSPAQLSRSHREADQSLERQGL